MCPESSGFAIVFMPISKGLAEILNNYIIESAEIQTIDNFYTTHKSVQYLVVLLYNIKSIKKKCFAQKFISFIKKD